MTEGLYDEDGIDGPFERRMAQAIRDDAKAQTQEPATPDPQAALESLGHMIADKLDEYAAEIRQLRTENARMRDALEKLEDLAEDGDNFVNSSGWYAARSYVRDGLGR